MLTIPQGNYPVSHCIGTQNSIALTHRIPLHPCSSELTYSNTMTPFDAPGKQAF